MVCFIGIETCFLRLILIFFLAGFHRNTSKSQTFSILNYYVSKKMPFCQFSGTIQKTMEARNKTLQTISQICYLKKTILNLENPHYLKNIQKVRQILFPFLFFHSKLPITWATIVGHFNYQWRNWTFLNKHILHLLPPKAKWNDFDKSCCLH